MADSILPGAYDGLYANVYLKSPFPRPKLVQWLRGKLIGRAGALSAYLLTIAPNIIHFLTHPTTVTWDSFTHALSGIGSLLVPSFIRDSPYVMQARALAVVILILCGLAWLDKWREDNAVEQQKAAHEAGLRQQLQQQQQEGIKHAIEMQLGHRWYGGSSVVSSLPSQTVETQANDRSLLPPSPAPLLEREDDVQWLVERLYPKPSRVVALYGPAGIGKSSVVAAALARAQDRFYDGVAIIDCSISSNVVDLLALALARFAPFSVAAAQMTTEALTEVAMRVLKGNRTLVILENVPDGLESLDDLINPLRAAEVAVVALSRAALDEQVFPVGAYRELQPLTEDTTRQLLATLTGGAVDPQSARELFMLVGGNPLSLSWLALYARATGRPLAQVARELGAWPGKTPMTSDPLDATRIAQYLVAQAPRPARRLLRALAAHPTMTLSEEMANEYAEKALGANKDTREALKTLTAWGLLVADKPKHGGVNLYAHTLVRDEARRLFDRLPQAMRSRDERQLERTYKSKAAQLINPYQTPDQEAYSRLLLRASLDRETRRIRALCYDVAKPWRDASQYGALLLYAPLALAAIDRRRESFWPWYWLWFRTPRMSDIYYHLLFYYADALTSTGHVRQASAVYARCRRIARFRWNRLFLAEVYGGMAVVASTDTELGDIRKRRIALQESSAYYTKALAILARQRKSLTAIQDSVNARVGLARIALSLGDIVAAEREATAGWNAIKDIPPVKKHAYQHTMGVLWSVLGDIATWKAQMGGPDQNTQFDVAERSFQSALQYFNALGDASLQIETIKQLSGLDLMRNDPDAAEKRLRETVDEWRSPEPTLGEGLALLNLGGFYLNRGDYARACETIGAACDLLRRTRDRQSEATALMNLGYALAAMGDVAGAERRYRDSLIAFREATDKWGTSAVFQALGDLARQRGHLADAEDLLTEARRVSVNAGDRASEANILLMLGNVAQDRSQFELAHSYYQEARDIYEGLQTPQQVAWALSSLADLEQRLCDLTAALTHLDQAESLFHADTVNAGIADTRRAKGVIAYLRGDTTLAEQLLREAAATFHSLPHLQGEGLSLLALGTLDLDRGFADKAHESTASAIRILRGIQCDTFENVGVYLQGRVALARGDTEGVAGAERSFARAYQYFSKVGDQTFEGWAQLWRGRLAFMQGHLDDAQSLISHAVTAADTVRDYRNQAMALVFHAELHAAQGQRDTAVDKASAALDIALRIEYPLAQGYAKAVLAALRLQAGEVAHATADIEQALQLLTTTQAHPQRALALCTAGQICASQGAFADATTHFNNALQVARDITDAFTLALVTRIVGGFIEQQTPGSPEASSLLHESERIVHQSRFHLLDMPAGARAHAVIRPAPARS